MFKGSMVALVTPMNSDGSIAEEALLDLVEWHIHAKTQALIIAGTTGESATLTAQEQNQIIAKVVKQVNKRIPVIAGTGSNSTQHTLELTLAAKKAGADACLIVTPYYNKPPQNGLYEHYKFITENSGFPTILYNVPGRTGCDLLPETVARISELAHVIGIKEATGKIDRVTEIASRCRKDFAIYSGDDATAMDLMLCGGHGVISVTANVVPHDMYLLCDAALSGDKEKAKKLNDKLMPLHQKLFVESNPIPTKWILHEMGLIPSGIRLPLLPLDTRFHEELRELIKFFGLQKDKVGIAS